MPSSEQGASMRRHGTLEQQSGRFDESDSHTHP